MTALAWTASTSVMNYRHAYHAGNFADVLKHAVLARVIDYLKLKPQAFRVIDTHAGIGRYDLESVEAGKTGEWTRGIGQLLSGPAPGAEVRSLLAPYLETVRSLNVPEHLRFYPGSPLVARTLMRRGDQLVANELHDEDHVLLEALFRDTADTKVLNLDAWIAVKSLLPPKERRGLVLIDPPFEDPGEFTRIKEGLTQGLRRFASGIYMIWYPLKDGAEADRFLAGVRHIAAKGLDVRLMTKAPDADAGLTGTGLIVVNPPYRLRAELELLLPYLRDVLGQGAGASYEIGVWGEGLG